MHYSLILKMHKKKTKKELKMSHGGNIYELRSWMYAHKNYAGFVTNKFLNKAKIFMYLAGNTPLMQETSKMLCLCRKCKNTKFARSETVWKHLVNRGFTPILHGEGDHCRNEASSSSSQFEDVGNSEEPNRLHTETSYHQEDQMVDNAS